ncbi:MAG TPA: DedA family protein [Anaerolineaceae bacterium]|nr:DedA family protein [Anaerolineaceae bacterium]HQH85170.1 DedA family protein [Anaerolineaceae bacterium]
MDFIMQIVDFILHVDKYLDMIIATVGNWTYVVLFIIIFIETGLVVTPFLPGDSLLFAAGAFAARGAFDVILLYVLMAFAAVLGDTANYWIGHYIGPRVFTTKSRLFKKEYLDRTQAFYEKHGGKTIFLARFIPIIRTFAPFVAGVGKMTYGHFITYNIVGGIVWTAVFIFGGYFFGNLPFVEKNFSLVIIAIIVISVLPAVYEAIKNRRQPAKPAAEEKTPAATE